MTMRITIDIENDGTMMDRAKRIGQVIDAARGVRGRVTIDHDTQPFRAATPDEVEFDDAWVLVDAVRGRLWSAIGGEGPAPAFGDLVQLVCDRLESVAS